MLPLIASRTSSSLGPHRAIVTAVAHIICPDLQ
jgi:hypothetical protein